MDKNKTTIQLVWGIALIFAGIGVFYRIPTAMLRIETIGQFSSAKFFIRFCFYFMGVLLIGGGIKKVYNNYRKSEGEGPVS
ncbi:MAG: hypothetical protein EHM85_11295 [Desulfobacteraceae bacterium]|nr:MAG: hypothetical protein EHM85_11295 [Desulfobacteraceae bacterium]